MSGNPYFLITLTVYFGRRSNKIHERVEDFLQKIFVNGTECKLIHGQAWLKLGGGKEFQSGKSWFAPLKRAILAPFGVGTIDQALLSVLKARHFFVRSFGLAGKVVILDEVHSYDVYTGTLLEELVKSLLAMNCSVIILSATLTRDKRASFFQGKIPSSENYPLITSCPKDNGLEIYTPPSPDTKEVYIQTVNHDVFQTAQLAVEKAEQGMCLLWVANTVPESQQYFKAVMSEKKESDEFKVGLLHSRFPAYRREELEQEWIGCLGKDSQRPNGCILISTQIVEQSVDIDADFIISELAPTDMLLQRMGRLWRHERERRPCDNPKFLIRCRDIDNAGCKKDLEDALGKSRFVYSPYVLWRSFQIWKNLKKVILPDKIRNLLEATYNTLENEPQFIIELKEKLETKKIEMKLKALGRTAEAFPELPDDEEVVTRYGAQVQIKTLLVKKIDQTGTAAEITLINGETVIVDMAYRNFGTTKKLYQNIAPINKNYFRMIKNFKVPAYLSKHIYGELLILIWQDDGSLTLSDYRKIPFSYDNEKGVYKSESQFFDKKSSTEEFDDEFDW